MWGMTGAKGATKPPAPSLPWWAAAVPAASTTAADAARARKERTAEDGRAWALGPALLDSLMLTSGFPVSVDGNVEHGITRGDPSCGDAKDWTRELCAGAPRIPGRAASPSQTS